VECGGLPEQRACRRCLAFLLALTPSTLHASATKQRCSRTALHRPPAFSLAVRDLRATAVPKEPMTAIRKMWQRITRTKYTRELEAEIARQRAEIDRQRAEIDRLRGCLTEGRAENRALLNSVLGIAGIPPLKFPAQSHSESSTRPLADDDSTFRLARCGGPPPPANHAGTNGPSALRQEPERPESSGASLPEEQSTRPRNDSPQFSETAATRDSSVGARYIVPGDHPWRDAAHSASLPGANTRTKTAGETPTLQKARPVAPPHRRRSWHQINRILEIESARKPVASD